MNPPPSPGCRVDFPAQHIMVLALDREKRMNSIPYQLHWDLEGLLNWFDHEPSLRVAIITGVGQKAFCAGSDLIEILDTKYAQKDPSQRYKYMHPPSGFAGISRRSGKKPIIAAVNGLALGGGFEIVLNCDMVIASPKATFGLPEAKRGLYASGGGLPRLLRTLGLPLAGDLALTGRTITAQEALSHHLINQISKRPEDVLGDAITVAKSIAAISPDAIIVTRAALREAWETSSVERAYQVSHDRWEHALMEGENAREGLEAFKAKREPVWKASKL